VRWIEKRGISRLWSVILVFLGILVAATLLVLAILPGIQRGSGALRDFLKPAQESAADPVPGSDGQLAGNDGSAALDTATRQEADQDKLGSAMATSVHELRTEHRSGPIGWALTEITDEGEQ